MPRTRCSKFLSVLASLAMLLGAAAACTPGDGSDESPADESAAGSDPAGTPAAYSASDEGNAVVWYDGVKHENFRGDCEISRRNGIEDVGDISTPGIVVSVAVDNVASNPAVEMNFVAITETRFTMVRQGMDLGIGSITGIAYESGLTPKGTSQALAMVAFSGVSEAGVPVVAHVVCEIQNKF